MCCFMHSLIVKNLSKSNWNFLSWCTSNTPWYTIIQQDRSTTVFKIGIQDKLEYLYQEIWLSHFCMLTVWLRWLVILLPTFLWKHLKGCFDWLWKLKYRYCVLIIFAKPSQINCFSTSIFRQQPLNKKLLKRNCNLR